MKGVIFTELFSLVEDNHGYELLDRVIEKCNLESGGAYTGVGTYSCSELVQIVGALSEELDLPIPDLVKLFGGHLFGRFFENNPELVKDYSNAFEMLKAVEDIIHVEVRKLWANVELPTFNYEEPQENQLVMHYQSSRPFADLCEGLMGACIEHFGEPIKLERVDTSPDGTRSTFTLTKQEPALVG